jgi:hypothetical protein
MIIEMNTVPEEAKPETNQFHKNISSLNKEALILTLPAEKKLPPPPLKKELPVSKWTMPSEPQGYIKSRKNDSL